MEEGIGVVKKRVRLVKARPDYEPLFSILDGLRLDGERRYWIREHSKDGNISDIGEDFGQIATEVKIALPMSHNSLTTIEEYVQ